MAKLAFGAQLHKALQEGVEKTARVVAPNYGSSGKSTIVEPRADIPMVMNSGAKILADFSLEASLQQMGCGILCNGTRQIANSCGDGVSTTVILCNALIRQGEKMLSAGVNPMLLRSGMLKAAQAAVEALERQAIPVRSEKDLYQIARNATRRDDVTELVCQAIDHAGADGEIRVEDTQLRDSAMRIGDVRYDYGWSAPEFANDPTGRMAELHAPYVLLVDKVIRDIYELQTILEQVSYRKVPLLIIAREIKPEPLKIILMNVKRGNAHIVVSQAPGHGEARHLHMEALAARLKCTLIDECYASRIRDCGLEACARIDRATVTREETCLTGLPPEDLLLTTPLRNRLDRMLAQASDDYEKEKLQLARSILVGKSVVIQVGGVTEVEMFERKQCVESALLAVQAARKGGFLPGGGKGYLLGIPPILKLELENDARFGAECVAEALKEPIMALAENVGFSGKSVCLHALESADMGHGFNMQTGAFEDLVQSGIIDPAKNIVESVRVAVETAAALLTVQAAVYEIRDAHG